MSTERLSFGFNSLIPETYKNKAEAFAKCLQHKLLSLGRMDSSSGTCSGESRRLSSENEQANQFYFGPASTADSGNEGRPTDCCSVETNRRSKTDESDEEFCSHSESENGDWTDKKEVGRTKQKLTSMSSEDSTVDSWSSCQENLTDTEKFDSENEEANSLAAQVRGSPTPRSFNIRSKRKEIREKTWKRNSRKNHSSSTESVDSEGMKQAQNRQSESSDPEFCSYILLDGLEPEDDEIPHRILRESSSTSNLERHFSGREARNSDFHKSSFKLEKKVSEESAGGVDAHLLTPPPSPNVEREVESGKDSRTEGAGGPLHFAQVEANLERVDFLEVECMKDFDVDGLSRSVKNINGVIVEVASDSSRDSQVPLNCPEDFVITWAQVLQDEANERRVEEDVEDIESAEDDDILSSRSQMRRCSSLKSWKTPPGTPGGKKIVRFADALGLDLADVRTFLDEIPRIPSSAYEDLQFEAPKSEAPLPPKPILVPLFQQPGSKLDFLDTVHRQKISLESALVTDEGVLTVTGFVRVLNLSFHKSVHVRYTTNGWETFSDLQATYVPNSCDGFSDRFSFVLYGHTLKVGERLEFALRLECGGGAQYWDNNGGLNYVLNCLPQTSPNCFFSSPSSSSSSYSNQVDPWFDFY